jgi:hypothetical protein
MDEARYDQPPGVPSAKPWERPHMVGTTIWGY